MHVDAREVIVDVLVTDSDGKPVHGLQQSDFTVEENGHPQTIRSFYESATAMGPPSKAVPLPLGEYTNSRSASFRGPVTIFLLDALNGPTRSSTWLSTYLAAMPSGREVGIFWLSRRVFTRYRTSQRTAPPAPSGQYPHIR